VSAEASSAGLHGALRLAIRLLLVVAPLALGAVHEPAWIPLLTACFVVGVLSWGLGHWERAHGRAVPGAPGTRLLLAFHAVILLQLVPLPPALLRLLSPGSFRAYDAPLLVPLAEWRPVSVSPVDTARGLLFLAGVGLLYAACVREFGDGRGRRALAATVVATGLLLSVEAFLQAAGGDTRIYGLWRPRIDFAVFGPYVNRSHFAGYQVMAIPLALAFAGCAMVELGRRWRDRPRGFVALGEAAGSAALGLSVVAMTLVAGLVATQSRGAAAALAVACVVVLLAFRRRRVALVALGLAAVLGVAWIGVGGLAHAFATRGFKQSRLDVWADVLRMVPNFPVFGSGFNAFGRAYPPYQTSWPGYYWGEAHNEYLQVLVDTGLAGAALAACALGLLLRGALAGARSGIVEAGLLAALLGALCHNLVDFNWQIPANAMTFAALAGAAVGGGRAARAAEPA
jgi:O-antigen ligase